MAQKIKIFRRKKDKLPKLSSINASKNDSEDINDSMPSSDLDGEKEQTKRPRSFLSLRQFIFFYLILAALVFLYHMPIFEHHYKGFNTNITTYRFTNYKITESKNDVTFLFNGNVPFIFKNKGIDNDTLSGSFKLLIYDEYNFYGICPDTELYNEIIESECYILENEQKSLMKSLIDNKI